jgi:CheY-like chemotaxis protein/two-component sensor histidine kinase
MKLTPPKSARNIFSSIEVGEEKARLIAALGHDLKGPLHVLGLSLQNLAIRTSDDQSKEILQTAEAAFDEVASLNDDLLDALRFGIGVVSPKEEGITLANLFEDVKRRFRRRSELEGVELRVAPTRIHCVADRHLLQRIVANLVENALKHAQATRVLVGARLRNGSRVSIQIMDDGRGIPESELPSIFEEWFRGRQATSDGTRGQGLGLWAVQRCVEAMRGSVAVDSLSGKGTIFTVEFDAYAKRRERPVLLPFKDSDGLKSKVVAVLDDDVNVLRALRTSLESLGLRVFATSDDLYLLASMAKIETPPDLFLLDFNLGGTTVERTLRMLKGRFGTRFNAIVITGHSNDSRLHELEKIVPVIFKPLSQANLRAIVEVLSGRRECSQSAFS